MTAHEIWDKINYFIMDEEADDAVCNVIDTMYYVGKEDEAVAYIEKFFQCDNNIAKEAFKIYKEKTGPPPSPQQVAYANAVAREALNKPKCPTCSSKNVQKISSLSKAGSVAVFGIFSQKVRHQFKCNNCGYEW